MKIKALARGATLFVLLGVPVVAIADDYGGDKNAPTAKDKDTTKDTAKDKDKPMGAKLTDAEMQVLAHLHAVNQMEIDAGNVALKNASKQAIKDYAKTVIKDHQQNDKDIMAFAKEHKQVIGRDKASSDSEQQEMKDTHSAMTHLKTLKGAEFDREYLKMMVDGHDKELAKIDPELLVVKDDHLTGMLKDLKPVYQRHSDAARDLQKSEPQASR